MLKRFKSAWLTLIVALTCLLLSASVAYAKVDKGAEIADEAAVRFKEQRYAEAAELFERSFALNPTKLVRLRNAGRAYEEAGKLEYACLIFERYLKQAPISPEKVEVKQRLDRLRKRLAEAPPKAEPITEPAQESAKVPDRLPVALSVPTVEAKSEDPSDEPRIAAWATAGVGALVLAGGLVWALSNESDAKVIEDRVAAKGSEYPGGISQLESDRAEVRFARTLSWSAVGVGTAVLGGGLLWALWPQSRERAVIAPSLDGPGLRLALRF